MRVEASIVVKRPAQEVWAFMTDPFHMPRVGRALGLLGVRMTSPGQLRLGSTMRGRLALLGFEARMTGTITHWDPPHSYAASAQVPGLSFSTRRTVEATADGTRVVRVTEYSLPAALRPLAWIVAGLMARQEKAVLVELKRLLESGRG